MTSEKTIDRAAIRAASEIKPVPEAKSHPDVIVLDTETTGLIPGRDHLLTVGVCDGEGREVLYLELCPPLECDAWPMAEAVNGISPWMCSTNRHRGRAGRAARRAQRGGHDRVLQRGIRSQVP